MDNLKYTIPKHVIFTEFDDDTGLLVDLNTKRYHQLNETGAFIWRTLANGKTSTAVANALTESYEVDAEHAATSVNKFIAALEAQKLINTSA